MSQRDSGYERRERDLYETPAWVTSALLPHLPRLPEFVWEPAAGSGKMSSVLKGAGMMVKSTDIESGNDFFAEEYIPAPLDAIITNPPYVLATEFIQRALAFTQAHGLVAMLLRTDFDHAKTRQHLFSRCRPFAKKLVLTKRIVWFEDAERKAQPSFNHAWYIWDWLHSGPPTLAYAL